MQLPSDRDGKTKRVKKHNTCHEISLAWLVKVYWQFAIALHESCEVGHPAGLYLYIYASLLFFLASPSFLANQKTIDTIPWAYRVAKFFAISSVLFMI